MPDLTPPSPPARCPRPPGLLPVLLAALLAACAAAPAPWSQDAAATFAAARANAQDCVVYFALPGRELSDRMQQVTLADAAVASALRAGGFHSLVVDGTAQQRMYAEWVGSGEGMGVSVLDAQGRVYAARPGPQDPPELAAFLRRCAAARAGILAARAALAQAPGDSARQMQLGSALLELGCRRETEQLLTAAALGGEVEAKHLLGRLAALEGRLQRAQQWLAGLPRTPAVQVTEGYLQYKQRRHQDAAATLAAALQRDLGGERQRALLFYGKALHELGRDDEARAVLAGLAAEATGSTFEAAAGHALRHLDDPAHTH